MKKLILFQSMENQNAQKSLKDLLQKNEALLIEKIEFEKPIGEHDPKQRLIKETKRDSALITPKNYPMSQFI